MKTFFRTLPGFFLAILLATGCNPIEPGVWQISGNDEKLGAFSGTLEFTGDELGRVFVTRVVTLQDVTHHDGRTVETAWTGIVTQTAGDPWPATFSLTRAHFIPRVGSMERTAEDADPLEIRAKIFPGPQKGLDIVYTEAGASEPRIVETGVWQGPPGQEPIFRADRVKRPTHAPPGPLLKALLFSFFDTFHELPAVQPYVDNPAFQRAVHHQIVERTDFDYYRQHPDRIRVVNKVVDEISLAETEIRANAFRASFAEKEAHYQGIMDSGLMPPHGMLLTHLPPDGREVPDGDANLWTGVYAYTQALRYRHTGDEAALDNLRQALAGILTTLDITRNPMTFARTLRAAGPPIEGRWREGDGEFAHLHWMDGGNNDMAKGLLLGMVAGWEVLPEGDPLRAQIPSHAMDLLELCEFLEERPPECGPGDNAPELPSLNAGMALLLAGLTNDDPDLTARGLAYLRQPIFTLYAGIGGGPLHIFGISDWSGNHLTLATNTVLEWLVARAGDAELEETWRFATGEAWKILRKYDHPLHAAKAAALQAFHDPDEQREAEEEAIWGLRSFQIPKHPHPIDRSIRSDFVLSPWPSLPWKLDWTVDDGRQQSLVGVGMVEDSISQFRWNWNPLGFRKGGNRDNLLPGVDYLFLYWMARDGGLITADD